MQAAWRRFATGIYMLWFPVKSPAAADAFCGEVLSAGITKALRLDIALPAAGEGKTGPEAGRPRMAAAGLLVLNPPYGLDAEMREAAPTSGRKTGRRRAAGCGLAGWRGGLKFPGNGGQEPPQSDLGH